MHKSSVDLTKKFFDKYSKSGHILLDVGCKDINGSIRSMVPAGVTYIGMDMSSGPNVDVVVSNPYSWNEIGDDKFDLILCSNVLEHVEFPQLIFNEINKKIKIDGFVCFVAPSRGPEHKFPLDCWRFLPDGFRALAKAVGFNVVECDFYRDKTGFTDNSDRWGDCWMIAQRKF